jgi:hypothetical protein
MNIELQTYTEDIVKSDYISDTIINDDRNRKWREEIQVSIMIQVFRILYS